MQQIKVFRETLSNALREAIYHREQEEKKMKYHSPSGYLSQVRILRELVSDKNNITLKIED